MKYCIVCKKDFAEHDEQQLTQCAVITRENEQNLMKFFNYLDPGDYKD